MYTMLLNRALTMHSIKVRLIVNYEKEKNRTNPTDACLLTFIHEKRCFVLHVYLILSFVMLFSSASMNNIAL